MSARCRRQYNCWRVANASGPNQWSTTRTLTGHIMLIRTPIDERFGSADLWWWEIPSSIDKFGIQWSEIFWTRCCHLWLLSFVSRYLGHLSSDGWSVCACGILVMSTIQRQWKNENPMVRKVSGQQTQSVVSWLFFYLCWICLIKLALCDLANSDIFDERKQPMSRYRMCALCRILRLFVDIRSNMRFLLINPWQPLRCNLMVTLNYHVQWRYNEWSDKYLISGSWGQGFHRNYVSTIQEHKRCMTSC